MSLDKFRMAIFGDFTGRAARGLVEVGPDLANRRAIKLDVDTIDEIIESFATTLVLPIGKDGAGVEVKLTDLDALKAELDSVCGNMTHTLLNNVPGLDHSSMEAMCRYVFERMRGHSNLVSSVEIYRPSLGYRAIYEASD